MYSNFLENIVDENISQHSFHLHSHLTTIYKNRKAISDKISADRNRAEQRFELFLHCLISCP